MIAQKYLVSVGLKLASPVVLRTKAVTQTIKLAKFCALIKPKDLKL